jgi:uncharacterized protein (UPF0128 family)
MTLFNLLLHAQPFLPISGESAIAILEFTVPNEMNELYFTYLNYPPKIRRVLYTTNWIERLNKEFRRTF